MAESTAPWSEEGYADVVSAARSGDDLEVEFANGDVVLLPASRFGVTHDFRVEADPEDGLSVRIHQSSDTTIVLAWTQLRAASDPQFAQELRRRETEEARRIGLRLRALREDKNLNQRDVANLVGMSAPQLSKIESGSLDLRLSTVQSLLKAMGASLADIAGPDAPEISQKAVIKGAEGAGVPREVVARLVAAAPRPAVAHVFERAFGWRVDEVVAGVPPRIPLPLGVAFKATRAGGDPSSSPLVLLGRTIADVVRRASRAPAFRPFPSSGSKVYTEARDEFGGVTLTSLATWAWNRGVPVVPMAARGGFSAAVWNEPSPPVIVLKDSRELAVYWLFDLAHEVAHLALGDVGQTAIVDIEAPNPRDDSNDAVERAANDFALEVLLPNHKELLHEVRREARGSHLRFKGAVSAVARTAHVSPGLLGMIAAYALTDVGQEKDRWGSATNLARSDGRGRDQVQQVAQRFMSTTDLTAVDALLLRELVLWSEPPRV